MITIFQTTPKKELGEDLIKINDGSSSCGGSTPVSEMKTSTKGIDFITSYEGYSSNIYDAENPYFR